MGQKVNPHGLRIGIIKTWDARWYADKDYANNLHEDMKIRKFLKTKLATASLCYHALQQQTQQIQLSDWEPELFATLTQACQRHPMS